MCCSAIRACSLAMPRSRTPGWSSTRWRSSGPTGRPRCIGPANGVRKQRTRCSPGTGVGGGDRDGQPIDRAARDQETSMTTLWDTTGSDVVKALSAERRSAGALAFGLALTLVVVTDQRSVEEAERAATAAAAAHPSRLLVVIRRHVDAPAPRLDAEVLIGGRLGPGEAVVMRMYGRLGLHAESVVLPLLAAGAPVVAWGHAPPPGPPATHAPPGFAAPRVPERSSPGAPPGALRKRAEDYAPGDTDLAWTRCTGWRAILASTLDSVSGRRGDPVRVLGG